MICCWIWSRSLSTRPVLYGKFSGSVRFGFHDVLVSWIGESIALSLVSESSRGHLAHTLYRKAGRLTATCYTMTPSEKKTSNITWGWKRSKNDIEFGLLPALAVHLMHVESKKIAALAGWLRSPRAANAAATKPKPQRRKECTWHNDAVIPNVV